MTNSINLSHYVGRECELHGVANVSGISFMSDGDLLPFPETLPGVDEDVIHGVILSGSVFQFNAGVISISSTNILYPVTRYHIPISGIGKGATELVPYKIKDSESLIVTVSGGIEAILFIGNKEIYMPGEPLNRYQQDITLRTYQIQ